jgi:hypothetical protein
MADHQRMGFGALMIGAGGALEVTGFVLIALELERLERVELGRPGRLTILQKRLRRLLRLRGKDIVVKVGSGKIAAGGSLHARGKVTHAPAVLLEDKVRRLERVVDGLAHDIEQVENAIDTHRASVTAQMKDLQRKHADLDRERREERRRAAEREISVQARATACFVIGTAMSVFGGLLTL